MTVAGMDPETGEITGRSKIIEQKIQVNVPIIQGDNAIPREKKRGRPRKYKTIEIPL